MKYFLVLSAVLVCCTLALAEPILKESDVKDVSVDIAKLVDIYFMDAAAFYLDVEAGQTCASDTKDFKAVHNCAAKITGMLVSPSLPSGVTMDWKFVGDGQCLNLPGAGAQCGKVMLWVTGVTPTTPSGCYTGGMMTICIEAL